MNRNFLTAIAAVAVCTPIVFGADEALPKAETIIERYLEVTGGRAAYEKHKSEEAKVAMEFVGKGMKAGGIRYADSGNNSRESFEIEGIGKIESGVVNGVAWESNAMTGSRIMSGVEKADRLRSARFNGPLYWRELWKTAETTGIETVEGEECYRVVMTPAEGKPETNFYSKKTGLMVKQSRVITTQMGEVPVEISVKDYKTFGGIQTPTRITQQVMGNEILLTVEAVQYDVKIPSDKFDPPAEVKRLMAK